MNLEGFFDASAILRAGVYILVAKGQVIYVGKSKEMLKRVYSHRNIYRAKRRGDVPSWVTLPGIHFDQVFIQPCRLEDLDALEAAMIEKYKPKYNTKLKRPGLPTTFVIDGHEISLEPKPVEPIGRRI